MTADFVTSVIASIREIAPELRDDAAQQLETNLRREWGGERPYIAKNIVRAAAINALAQGETVAGVQRRFGLSRSGAYRLKNSLLKKT